MKKRILEWDVVATSSEFLCKELELEIITKGDKFFSLPPCVLDCWFLRYVFVRGDNKILKFPLCYQIVILLFKNFRHYNFGLFESKITIWDNGFYQVHQGIGSFPHEKDTFTQESIYSLIIIRLYIEKLWISSFQTFVISSI